MARRVVWLLGGLAVILASCTNTPPIDLPPPAPPALPPAPPAPPSPPPGGPIGTAGTGGPGEVVYTLGQAGKVSLAVYDSQGQMVRTLKAAERQTSGRQKVTWDGKDDAGNSVPSGSYTWKLLQTQGLRAAFKARLITNLPDGQDWWETGVGNHIGARSVTLDPQGNIYIGGGMGESVGTAVKLNPAGDRRIWSGWQPEVSVGRYALTVVDGTLYSLGQDGNVFGQGVDEPGGVFASVGGSGGNKVGFRWDARWPGDSSYNDAEQWKFTCDQSKFCDFDPLAQRMDMAGFGAGSSARLALSYADHDSVQWRDPKTGAVLGQVTVSQPLGVAFDNDGSLLVLSGDKLLRLKGSQSPQTVLRGLNTPFRVDVDRSNGDVYLAELGNSQQVKRFSSSGQLLNTYGKAGGRNWGLYDAKNFRDVLDLEATGDGFMVVEAKAPRRITRLDRGGNVVKDWYGGGVWIPSCFPEPGRPAVVWCDGDPYRLLRLELDLGSNTWKLHSVYDWRNATNASAKYIGPTGGTGLSVWKPRRINGATYLALDGSVGKFAAMRVNEGDWSLSLLTSGGFYGPADLCVKTDAGRDFKDSECSVNQGANIYDYARWDMRSDEKLNYYALNQADGTVVKIPMTGLNGVGAPTYQKPDQVTVFAKLPSLALQADGKTSNVYPSSHFFSFGPDGAVYGAFGIGPKPNGWGQVDHALLIKWNPDGTTAWQRLLVTNQNFNTASGFTPGYSLWSTFKNNAGVIPSCGCVVATDFNGGWDGRVPGNTYVWDRNGLWVGSLLESLPGGIESLLNSENGTGAVYQDPGSGEVLYYSGAGENAGGVFSVRGFEKSQWLELTGSVSK